ncbi:amino acid permease [Nocardiopsis suaedae]|uniref:Amino acid permease n=1 Tax=Nocardiopsis suaedae TaxID=3018444 RepID=A0ABT4TGS2_9ACTN|nr:amino acid permease [Nocardiopsis suaedae]MDA2803903.1 amino acid permease [Nocardiopsis suaedae]
MTTRTGTQGASTVLTGAAALAGAGVFAVLAPAADEAGTWLTAAVPLAAAVALCTAVSTARLASAHPGTGGARVYARERLGDPWGAIAAWAWAVGTTAAAAAAALALAENLAPERGRSAAMAALAVAAALAWAGPRARRWAGRLALATGVLAVAALVAAAWTAGTADPDRLQLDGAWPGSFGALGAAGTLFLAFAGTVRIAEAAPRPRQGAVPVVPAFALAGVALLYLTLGAWAVAVLGPYRAGFGAPVVDAVAASGRPALGAAAVAAAAAVASLGAGAVLLSSAARAAGVLAQERALPAVLEGPTRSWAATAVAAGAAVAVLEPATAVGIAAFALLAYHLLANASALRLGADEDRPPLLVALGGLAGCVVLGLSLPLPTVVMALAAVGSAAAVWLARLHLNTAAGVLGEKQHTE